MNNNDEMQRDSDGNRWWFNDKDEMHRLEGPAVEYHHGSKHWWLNGKRHRTDGPAIEWEDGDRCWYIEGKEYTESDFKKMIQK